MATNFHRSKEHIKKNFKQNPKPHLIKIQEPLLQGPKPRSVINQDFSTIAYCWLLLMTLQRSCRFVLFHVELQRKGQTAPKKLSYCKNYFFAISYLDDIHNFGTVKSVSRLSMSESMFLFPPHAFTAWKGTNLRFAVSKVQCRLLNKSRSIPWHKKEF
jgi:hypothetical protein